MPVDAPPKPPAFFKWWVCVLLLLASTLNYMDRQALSQTSERITDYFGIDEEEFSWLEGAFNGAFALSVLGIGYLADRGNIRLIYPALVVLWSLAGFASGLAESYGFLFACRFALGLFESGNIPCGVLTVKRILKPEERTLGNGMFQSGTALGAIITPLVVFLCLEAVGRDAIGITWQLPFRVVGAAGLIWAALWLVTVRKHHVQAPVPTSPAPAGDTYWSIFRDRRFWIALVVVMAINAPWRSYGFWLPKLLRRERGYSEDAMLFLSPGFFAAADLGALAVGFMVLRLGRGGMPLSRARLICFTACSLITTLSIVTALIPTGPLLIGALYLQGFGALGMFPIYYALSQEISSKHQGKVTGTLSCLNAFYLAALFPAQGFLIKQLNSYALALGLVGLFPLVGLVALALFWKSGADDPARASRSA
jgi:ACS family hexuronate transporter-like MFS transporter